MTYTLGTWPNGLAEWTDGDTAYLSVAFTWKLDEAWSKAVYYKALGYKVRAGGPGIFTRKHYLADVAELGGDITDAVAKHNPMATFASRGCPVGCFFCLPPESLIVTADGLTEIAKVKVGDLVLTHMGRYRRVTETMSRPFAGDLVGLRSGALSELFLTEMTPEHPVRTRRVSYPPGGPRLREFEWTDALAAMPSRTSYARDVFCYPRTNQVEVPEGGHPPGLPSHKITPEFMALIGWYLAEGYITSNPASHRVDYRVTFCLGHSDEEKGFAEAIARHATSTGLRAAIHKPSIGFRVMIHNVEFVRWLKKEFGSGASAKKVPLWVRLLPAELLRPMVEAWADGDGHRHLKKNNLVSRITTVSPYLATALREIVLKIGYSATINRHRNGDSIQGREVSIKPGYTVIYHMKKRQTGSITHDEGHVYSRISPSVLRQYDGMVYNIEVEEDNSYCTPAFTVHNCIVPKMEGKTFTLLPEFEPRPVLCDNNLSALPADYQDYIVSRYQQSGVPLLDANSGFEPRTFDDEVLARWTPINRGPWRFASDDAPDGPHVERVMKMLDRHGVSSRRRQVYTMIGAEPFDACMDRIQRVIGMGGEPYAQPFMKLNALVKRPHVRFDWTEATLKAVQRWVNGRFWKYVDFAHYDVSAKSDRALEPDNYELFPLEAA